MVASQRGQTLTRRIHQLKFRPRNNERRMCTRGVDVEKYSPTKGCAGCQKVTRRTVPLCTVASDVRHKRMERLTMQDPIGADRVVRTKTRHEEAFAKQ